MRGKCDIGLVCRRYEIMLIIAIKQVQLLQCTAIITNVIQDVDKGLLALSIDFLKFQQNRWIFAQHLGVKEKRTGIILTHDLPFTIFHNGWQLIHITDKEYLCSAERA